MKVLQIPSAGGFFPLFNKHIIQQHGTGNERQSIFTTRAYTKNSFENHRVLSMRVSPRVQCLLDFIFLLHNSIKKLVFLPFAIGLLPFCFKKASTDPSQQTIKKFAIGRILISQSQSL
jgi:hypothetical protein